MKMALAIWLWNGGAHHSRRKLSPYGMAKISRKGRLRPQRVCTRSLSMPTIGSLTASQMIPISAAMEASRGSNPTTSVRKMA
jgi:hypothetical protein